MYKPNRSTRDSADPQSPVSNYKYYKLNNRFMKSIQYIFIIWICQLSTDRKIRKINNIKWVSFQDVWWVRVTNTQSVNHSCNLVHKYLFFV